MTILSVRVFFSTIFLFSLRHPFTRPRIIAISLSVFLPPPPPPPTPPSLKKGKKVRSYFLLAGGRGKVGEDKVDKNI